MPTFVLTRDRLIVAEKAVCYRQVRRHSIPVHLEPVETVENAKLLLGKLLDPKPVEGLYAIALNSSGDFLGLVRLAEGTVDRASVYPRELVSFLLIETNATSLILAHSHPGGKAEASNEDKVPHHEAEGHPAGPWCEAHRPLHLRLWQARDPSGMGLHEGEG
ncbi:MAG TPA: JAB domain-containing protein [Methanoregulaceae archaeon]|nr:JAB domain-containing protein [Methanoregulaceae archaeon]